MSTECDPSERDRPIPTASLNVGRLRGQRSFPLAAHEALESSQLRKNLHHATATIRAKRAAVVAEVLDWEDLRKAGEALKNRALDGLDVLLTRFESQFSQAGGKVHFATDASDANDIVTKLVAGTGSREVVKVKSMATQEIGLNEALEQAGITAYETDLAELIVQLGNDWPSHILVPAIHKNRSEIREIFLKAIPGVDPDLTDDPKALAATARAHLRRRFLSARVAISGANFAVAETGTLVVVESEGNGRMCLTLPDTLISVVGVEKLLSSWEDLSVMLQLLPRSSTGERMNPYTSMWTGVTPKDGPQQVHVVLVDNGRTATLADPIGRDVLRCIRCSACLNVCPVYERVGGHAYGSIYPGPIGAVLSPQLTGVEANPTLPFASSLCGACFEVCPVRIDIPSILVDLRARVVQSHEPSPESVGMAAAGWVMGNSRRWRAAGKMVGLSKPARRLRLLPPPLGAWTSSRDLPEVPAETFREWWASSGPSQENSVGSSGSRGGLEAVRGGEGAGWNRAKLKGDEPLGRVAGGRAVPDGAPGTIAHSSREVVLARVAQALRMSRAGRESLRMAEALNTVPQVASSSEGAAGLLGPVGLLELFAHRLEDYGAVVYRVGGSAEIADAVQAALGNLRTVVPADLSESWLPDSANVERDDPHEAAPSLERFDATVSACALAVAETGTIILDGGAGQGRRALTLVPDHHVCVVNADQIVRNVPEAVRRLVPHRPITWISGPSATSDIELSRVQGVHGPRNLRVVLVGHDGLGTDSAQGQMPAQ